MLNWESGNIFFFKKNIACCSVMTTSPTEKLNVFYPKNKISVNKTFFTGFFGIVWIGYASQNT